MLVAAFAAGAAAYLTGSAWIGLLAGVGASVLFGLLHGLASITYRGNQIVSGVAINILAAGLTVLLGIAWFSQGGRTPSLPADAPLPVLDAAAGRHAPRRSHARAALCRSRVGPQRAGLPRHAGRAAHVVGGLPHPLRAAPPGRRREPRGGRHRRHLGRWPSLCRRRHRRRAVRLRRHLSQPRAVGRLSAAHDGRARLHRAGGPHLRQVETVRRARRLPPLRLPPGAGGPDAGREPAHRRAGSGPARPGAALHPRLRAAGRLHRPRDPAPGPPGCLT